MKILDVSVFKGRNIYSHYPVIKMILDIGEYANTPTNKIEGLNERILDAFPGLKKNHCGRGYEGGFLDKLNEGTYLAHVVEHVILEMQFMTGYDVRFGKTRYQGTGSRYYIVYEFENEVCGLECGKAAVFIIDRFIAECLKKRGGKKTYVNIDAILSYIKDASREAELGPSTAAISAEAKRRGIPVNRFGHESIIHLGYGKYRRTLQATLTDATSCISADIASNKQLTKNLLCENGIPVPEGKLVFSEISALQAAKLIGTPVTIKPHDSNQGKGVHLNLLNSREIKAAYRDASRYSSAVIVEKFIQGKDFRVLVVGGKVSAVSERLPASVIGDGIHTIEELIRIINRDENRGEHHEKPLTKIRLDDVTVKFLRQKGFRPDSILRADEFVNLRANGNLSTGGIAIDRTDAIHPENTELAVNAASILGIDIAGVDFVTKDISVPIRESGGAIVEVNTAPGIRMHLFPSEGTPRDVARDIVDYLYPTDEVLDFPIVSVTGTNGKTTTARLIAHVLQSSGKTVGLTTTSGTYVGGKCIHKGDDTGPLSAKVLLSNKNIDAAVLETARGGIIRAGLGYDLADVGVITNIAEDHLGLREVETIEDLAFIKSLVAEAVRSRGCAVLNADDPMTDWIIPRVSANIVFFTKDIESARRKFDREASSYVYLTGDLIMVQKSNGRRIPVAYARDIPITRKGTVGCNIENCLAATAALSSLGIPEHTIAAGLQNFSDNPGRFEFIELNGFSVLLDYAHNPPGYKALIDALPSLGAKRLVGIIGMPGDRTDSSIASSGMLCAEAFDQLYIKEDIDLRGRKKGEVAQLFYKAALHRGFSKKDIVLCENELDALQKAVTNARPGDLIAVFYEKLEPLEDYIHQLKQQDDKNVKIPHQPAILNENFQSRNTHDYSGN
jgi:cyanophycin synthetase